jgi:polyisoprenoid-binding protein YceI
MSGRPLWIAAVFLAAAAAIPPTAPSAAAPSPAVAPPSATAPSPTVAAPAGGPLTLPIDPVESRLGFVIHRPGETIEGRAHTFTGEVRLDPLRPERSGVTLRVTAASLETGNRIRDGKMRRSHLEVEGHPEILFRSRTIRAGEGAFAAGGSRKAIVEGVLSLHGVERDLLFPAAIGYDGRSLVAEGEVVLRLTDHAIPIPRFLWIELDDEVKVRFRFRAAPAGEGTTPGGAAGEAAPPGAPAGETGPPRD